MLNLYKALETKVLSGKTAGVEKARYPEIAANIVIDVLKMASEVVKAVKQLSLAVNNNNRIK